MGPYKSLFQNFVAPLATRPLFDADKAMGLVEMPCGRSTAKSPQMGFREALRVREGESGRKAAAAMKLP